MIPFGGKKIFKSINENRIAGGTGISNIYDATKDTNIMQIDLESIGTTNRPPIDGPSANRAPIDNFPICKFSFDGIEIENEIDKDDFVSDLIKRSLSNSISNPRLQPLSVLIQDDPENAENEICIHNNENPTEYDEMKNENIVNIINMVTPNNKDKNVSTSNKEAFPEEHSNSSQSEKKIDNDNFETSRIYNMSSEEKKSEDKKSNFSERVRSSSYCEDNSNNSLNDFKEENTNSRTSKKRISKLYFNTIASNMVKNIIDNIIIQNYNELKKI
jgi:hypothetical protein